MVKDIDFLPIWYKNSRRQSLSYKWQYSIIAVVFVSMVCWSFWTGSMISASSANNDVLQEQMSQDFNQLKSELKDLTEKSELIDKCKSKISLSAVLAEMSCVIDKNILLNKIQIIAQEYKDNFSSKNARTIISRAAKEQNLLDKDLILKVIINGLARDSENVADLICGLEDSEYFSKVFPSYTKSVTIKEKTLTDFEIECYICNYKIMQ
jgi:hypothetical protein